MRFYVRLIKGALKEDHLVPLMSVYGTLPVALLLDIIEGKTDMSNIHVKQTMKPEVGFGERGVFTLANHFAFRYLKCNLTFGSVDSKHLC